MRTNPVSGGEGEGQDPLISVGWRGRLIGRIKGGMNTELHAICDSEGRPLNLFVTAGQISEDNGVRALLSNLP